LQLLRSLRGPSGLSTWLHVALDPGIWANLRSSRHHEEKVCMRSGARLRTAEPAEKLPQLHADVMLSHPLAL
jgi:hypothetical protein